MKQAAAGTAAAFLLVWLVWNVWNVFSLAVGLRDGSWRRPLWWTRLCSVSLFVGIAAWIRGAFSTGLDVGETCQFAHHERFDGAYWTSHAEEFQKLFPLHSRCNAHFDLVPAWVNPAVVVCAAVALVALVAMSVLLGQRLPLRGKAQQSST
jgi:hypothetical protein